MLAARISTSAPLALARRISTASLLPGLNQSLPTGAPIQPSRYAIPVHDMVAARHFYGNKLGLTAGRATATTFEYNFFGHHLVLHKVAAQYRCQDFRSFVGELPVPHHGISLSVADFRLLLARLTEHRVTLSKAPHVIDKGTPLEQHMTWLKDPSGNNLVFNAFVKPANMFTTFKPVYSGQTQKTLTVALQERAAAAVPMTSSIAAAVEDAAQTHTTYIATTIVEQQQQQQQQL